MKILVARRRQETIRILAEHGFLTGLLAGAAEFGQVRARLRGIKRRFPSAGLRLSP